MKCRPAVGAATAPGSRAVHGLITAAIGGVRGALDVGRQRHGADLFEPAPEIRHLELQLHGAIVAPSRHPRPGLARQHQVGADAKALAPQ